MTVLLTDSVDFSQFLGKTVSPNVTAVCGIFTLGSALYLIATILMANQKWKWIEQSYGDLKANYKGTLDDKDIDDAFDNDHPQKTAKEQYKKLRCQMIALWIVMVLGLGVFTGILYMNGRSTNIPESIVNSQGNETNVDDSSENTIFGEIEAVCAARKKEGIFILSGWVEKYAGNRGDDLLQG